MIKRLLGIFATLLMLVLMGYVVLNRGSYQSMLNFSTMTKEALPEETPHPLLEETVLETPDSLPVIVAEPME